MRPAMGFHCDPAVYEIERGRASSSGQLRVVHGQMGSGKSVVRAGLASVAQRDLGWTVVGITGPLLMTHAQCEDMLKATLSDHRRIARRGEAKGRLLIALDELLIGLSPKGYEMLVAYLAEMLREYRADILICTQTCREVNTLTQDQRIKPWLKGIQGIAMSHPLGHDEALITTVGGDATA